MKYTIKIEINLPRERVIELFDNVDNMYKWQAGLVSVEHMSGELGETGAKSELIYKTGKREIKMIETVTVKNLPDEFSGTYEAKGVWNEVKNFFYEVDENTTRWTSECDFQLSGFMKLMGWLIPGAFKKETLKTMKQFKEFAKSSI